MPRMNRKTSINFSTAKIQICNEKKAPFFIIFTVLCGHTKTLTFIKSLKVIDFQYIAKKLQNRRKKNAKKNTTYQKNTYLCIVLINK